MSLILVVDGSHFMHDGYCLLFYEATLNDSFLADLDELSDNEDDLLDADNDNAEHMEEDIDGDLADIEALNYDDLDSVSKLQKTQRYTDIMQKVEDALEKGSDNSSQGLVLEDDPEYQLIVDCNALSVDIENEIVIIHNFIRDKRSFTLCHYYGGFSYSINYQWQASSEDVLQKTIDACDRALALDSAKKKVLDFVESRMGYIAPNLSAIVGSAVAAKLMGTAGGLSALAKMPACNVQLLGAKRKNLAGFSTATSQFRVGYLEQTEIFQSTPPALRMRACRLLAAKSTLAARVDSTRGDPTGKTGRSFRAEIHKKIEKWQEPPPAKQPKPLPVPDSEPKKKRGGRRLRKMKERHAEAGNRMQFGVPEESSLGDGLGEGYGMLGQAGSGKLRVSIGQSRLAAKVAKKFKERNYGSSGATSGLTSSLAFTPVQGIELSNPQANQLGGGTQNTPGSMPPLRTSYQSYSSRGSSNRWPLSSAVVAVTDQPLKSLKGSFSVPRFGWEQRRDNLHNNRRVSKVVAYYGLKSPPYKLDALEPYMSQRTLEVHWGGHHRGYVDALNKQLEKNDVLYGCTMDELIKVTYNNGNPLPEFNNAAQVWNHDFFWESMQPGGGQMPTLSLLQQIEKDFASFANFKEKFTEAALTSFGSAWVWLVLKREKKCLAIVKSSNAINPLVWNDIPIINLDVWEHAYYLDYKNDKVKYVNTFMNHLVSWNAAAARMARAQAFVNLGEPKIPVA
ncbi:U4/U6 small nuclear ribonucleoprotein Prp31 [Sesamum angolense]|uniref:superoxide dismutase n=1 Tax=Sesamum angolense TaxID=2727404 RepID=A0AAE1X073_9LAMI|nr:U4/U6 small nuclear ribonucleoprotein Prp31 [Sesamum angolense]